MWSFWKCAGIITVLLAILLCGAATAEILYSGTSEGNVRWELDDDGLLTISGNGALDWCVSWDLQTSTIRSLVIGEGITQVRSYAFSSCGNLTSVTLPSSLTYVGQGAFDGCAALNEIHVPSVEAWLNLGFYDHYSHPNVHNNECHLYVEDEPVTRVTVPDSFSEIGISAFRNFVDITEIILPEGLEKIGGTAFYGCAGLTAITIPDGVGEVGNGAFSNCDAVRYASLDSSAARAMGRADFSFRVPGTVYDLKYLYTEEEIIGLELGNVDRDATAVEIPEGVTKIASSAFRGCNKLTELTVLAGVTEIGDLAFYECTNLVRLVLPEGVTDLGESCFAYCNKLADFHVPSTVRNLGSYVFYHCMKLLEVVIPEGVTAIPNYAFQQSGIEKVTLPESLRSIGYSAFDCCSNLESIIIPDGVTSVGYTAFYSCNAIRYCSFDSPAARALSDNFSFRVPGNNYDLKYLFDLDDVVGLEIRAVDKDVVSFSIPENVTSIGREAFLNCSSLESVEIPASVTCVGIEAFDNCYALKAINLPDGMTGIGAYAFPYGILLYSHFDSVTAHTLSRNGYYFRDPSVSYCIKYLYDEADAVIGWSLGPVDKDVTAFVFPEEVTEIGNEAFSGCSKLTSLVIPDGLASVKVRNVFNDCPASRYCSLNSPASHALSRADYSFRVPGDNYDLIYLYKDNETTGLALVSADMDARAVRIRDGVTEIGDYAFYSHSDLEYVSIPDSVTGIGKYAFEYCTGLRSLTIPENVKEVGWEAFLTGGRIETVWIETTEDITGNNFGFWIGAVVYCHEYSPVESWALQREYTVVLIEETTLQKVTKISISEPPVYEAGGEYALDCYDIFPTAPGNAVSLSSDHEEVARVSNDGMLTAVAPGTATITVEVNGVTATFEVTVIRPYVHATDFTLQDVWVVAKRTQQAWLQGIVPENADLRLVWSTDSSVYAQVDGNGLVTGGAVGETTLTVKDQISGLTRKAAVHIVRPVTAVAFEEDEVFLLEDGSRQLTAHVTAGEQVIDNQMVTFSSSDEAVAVVDQKGRLYAVAPGSAVILADAGGGVSASCTVMVAKASILNLPGGTKEIQSEAFAGITDIDGIRIPGSVETIAEDAFVPGVTLLVPKGSQWVQWAEEHGYMAMEE